eukprot:4083810-Pyramimonas_sp.AAC.1
MLVLAKYGIASSGITACLDRDARGSESWKYSGPGWAHVSGQGSTERWTELRCSRARQPHLQRAAAPPGLLLA